MTTFTLPSFYVEIDQNGQAEAFRLEDVSLVFAPGVSNLTYSYTPSAQAETGNQIDTPEGEFYAFLIDGAPRSADDALPRILAIEWSGGTSYVAILERLDAPGENVIFLGGAPFEIGSAAEYNAFVAGLTGVGNVSGGSFGPGANIPLATLPDVSVTEDDVIFGTGGGNGDDFRGGVGNDLLQGNNGPDTLRGGSGEDTILGGQGDDVLIPGATPDEYDVLYPGLGSNDIRLDGDYGEVGAIVMLFDDFLDSGVPLSITIEGNNGLGSIFYPGEGQSTISGADDPMGADGLTLGGTFYGDTYDVTPSDDGFLRILASPDNDTINIGEHSGFLVLDYSAADNAVNVDLGAGTAGDGYNALDTISGRVSELRGTDFDDTIIGSANDERFILNRGNDTLDGGDGFDQVRYDRSGVDFVEVNLINGTAAGTWDGITFADTLSNIEGARGSREGDDRFTGDDGNNYFRGRGGNDQFIGNAGDDTMEGEDGFDEVTIFADVADISVTYVSDGIQIASADGVDLISGMERIFFNDRSFTIAEFDAEFGPSAQVIPGTSGDDDLVAGPGGDTIQAGDGNDTLTGGIGDDALLGGAGDDDIVGGDGNDNIASADGSDYAEGGPDDDLMGGGLGNDTMLGNGGNDTMGGGQDDDSMNGNDGNDIVNGGSGNDSIFGGEGNDTIGAGFNNDFVNGGGGDDDMGGGTGRDVIFGADGNDRAGAGEGDDSVYGENGNDFLAGGGRNDLVSGGAGDDTINGGDGDDTMTGGTGADEFVWNFFKDGDNDVITDFENGVDSFRMTGIDKAPGSGLQGFLDALNVTDTAQGALMSYEGHTILVQGVSASDLGLEDFTFL